MPAQVGSSAPPPPSPEGGGGAAAAHTAAVDGGDAASSGATNGANEQSRPPMSFSLPAASSSRTQCPSAQSAAVAGSPSSAICARSFTESASTAGVDPVTGKSAGSVKSSANASSR
jgi:hypothetical protein